MNFLKTKVFKNEDSVTWGKLLLIVGGILVAGTALTLVILKVFSSFN